MRGTRPSPVTNKAIGREEYTAATGDRYTLFLDPLSESMFFWWVTNVRNGACHSVLVRIHQESLDVVPPPRRVRKVVDGRGRALVEVRLDRGQEQTAVVEVRAESVIERDVVPARTRAPAPNLAREVGGRFASSRLPS